MLESLLSAFTQRTQNTGYSNPVLAPFSLSHNAVREGSSLPALRDRERGQNSTTGTRVEL